MDEESDVIDLTDEVGSTSKPTVEMVHDIETLGLDIPAFRVPDEAEIQAGESLRTSGGFASAGISEVPSSGILTLRRTGAFKRIDAASAEAGGVDSSEAPPAADYDRQAMVKTMQMQAVSPEDFEQYLQESIAESESLPLLMDQRLAPEVIVLPPRVLIRRWQEGAPPRIQRESFARRERQTTVPTIPSIPTQQQVETAAPEISRERDVSRPGAFQTMQLDALEIEAFEIEEEQVRRPPPKPRPTIPPNLQPPPQAQQPVAQPPPQAQQPVAQPPQPVQQPVMQPPPPQVQQAAPPPQQVPQPVPLQNSPSPVAASGGDVDPEMRGLIQELLEEQKAAQNLEQRPKRTRPRDVWFQEAFGEEFLRTLPADFDQQTLRDTEFIAQSLNLKRGARILDLACGFGRHAVELSSRGYEMVGLDLSMPMLQKALAESQQRGQSIKYLHGDMRELAFQEAFDGCYIWQTSFGYFDDRTNLKVLQGIHRALRVGGRFLIDVVNRDYVLGQMPSRTWWEGSSCIFLEEAEFDYNASVLHAKRSFIYEDGSPPLEQHSYVRLYSLHELRQMLNLSGFAVLEVSGELHHRGYFLGPSSGRLLVLAEKKKPKDSK